MKKLLFFLLFVSIVGFVNAQNIIAGQYSTSDYYHDYIPDTVIKVYNISTYLIDINNDGISDFKYTLHPYFGAMGLNSHSCNIRGLDSNKIALAKFDSCFSDSNNLIFNIGIARAFKFYDTINSNVNWDSLVYIEDVFVTYNMEINCAYHYSTDSAYTYIGLKVIVGTKTFYGWIKIVGLQVGYDAGVYYYSLTLGEFACNKEPLSNELNIFNAFTPNGDGVNDEFHIKGNNVKELHARIINRWGQELYKWDDASGGWDGKFKGNVVSAGAYFYIASITFNNGTVEEKKGSVEVVR